MVKEKRKIKPSEVWAIAWKFLKLLGIFVGTGIFMLVAFGLIIGAVVGIFTLIFWAFSTVTNFLGIDQGFALGAAFVFIIGGILGVMVFASEAQS